MKKDLTIIALTGLLCLALGCKDRAASTELEAAKARATLEMQNKEIVKRWLAGNDEGLFAVVDELIAEDCQIHYGTETFGRERLRTMCEAFPRSFSDSAHIIEDLIAENDKIVARLRVRVIHSGEFMGVAPTGETIEYSAYTLYRIEDGKIAELWMDHNATLELMKKLGISNERS